MSTSHSQVTGAAAVTTDSKPLIKHLVLVSKPVYMGVYVAIDAKDNQDAIAKLQERINDDDGEVYSQLTDLFGKMCTTAHGAVREEHSGFINSDSASDFELPKGHYHHELDMTGVVNPANAETVAHYHSISFDDLVGLDLTATEAERFIRSFNEAFAALAEVDFDALTQHDREELFVRVMAVKAVMQRSGIALPISNEISDAGEQLMQRCPDPMAKVNAALAGERERNYSMRNVIDGEKLSGQILIFDGQGPGNGSLICSIESFHWAKVVVKEDTTELWFENKLCLAIPDGIVQYAD